MTTLDFLAAQAIARARLLERAVHDAGHWQIEINGQREDAVKVRTPHRVVFLANFYRLPEGGAEVAWLLCNGEMISSMDVQLADTGPYAIEWSVGPDTVPTAVG